MKTHRFIGFVRIAVDSASKSVYLEKTGKASADAYAGTVKSPWSDKNVPALIAKMEEIAAKEGYEIGKPSKSGTRYNGIFAPNGRDGNTPVLMHNRAGAWIQFMASAPEKESSKDRTIQYY